ESSSRRVPASRPAPNWYPGRARAAYSTGGWLRRSFFALQDQRIGRFHRADAVLRFKPFNDEMPTGHILEVVHEKNIDDRAGRRPDHWYGFGGGLLGYDHAKP